MFTHLQVAKLKSLSSLRGEQGLDHKEREQRLNPMLRNTWYRNIQLNFPRNIRAGALKSGRERGLNRVHVNTLHKWERRKW
jgi:hypothetical protein